jgi:hypothetical protein
VRLPGRAPWEARYLGALAEALDGMDAERLALLRAQALAQRAEFSESRQVEAVRAFIMDVLAGKAEA